MSRQARAPVSARSKSKGHADAHKLARRQGNHSRRSAILRRSEGARLAPLGRPDYLPSQQASHCPLALTGEFANSRVANAIIERQWLSMPGVGGLW
jgi:hypothetical protein